jgi:hypothetical protein
MVSEDALRNPKTSSSIPLSNVDQNLIAFENEHSRPINNEEAWAAYNFEVHAQSCSYCRDPYEVHRAHEQLCTIGHNLARDVASLMFMQVSRDVNIYSTCQEPGKTVLLELPAAYMQVKSLLKAIERSLRHRSRTPFVSMDRTYYSATRTRARTRSAKKSVLIGHPQKTRSRPNSVEILDRSDRSSANLSVGKNTSPPKSSNGERSPTRGSLYAQDLSTQRRNAKAYSVEVREPSTDDRKEHRLAGYYR